MRGTLALCRFGYQTRKVAGGLTRAEAAPTASAWSDAGRAIRRLWVSNQDAEPGVVVFGREAFANHGTLLLLLLLLLLPLALPFYSSSSYCYCYFDDDDDC